MTDNKQQIAEVRLSQWNPKHLARAAGIFYLMLVIAGGFAHAYVREMVYIANDPAETSRLVMQHATLVRAGILIDLFGALAFLFVGLTLHELLHIVDRFAARLMLLLVTIAVAMTCINLIFQYGGVLLATKQVYSSVIQTNILDTIILLMFDMQHYGYILVQAFTGPWLFPFGYLVIRSNKFPKALGVFLIIGGIAYLTDLAVQIISPTIAENFSELILAPAIIAELSIIIYLIFRGIRT